MGFYPIISIKAGVVIELEVDTYQNTAKCLKDTCGTKFCRVFLGAVQVVSTLAAWFGLVTPGGQEAKGGSLV